MTAVAEPRTHFPQTTTPKKRFSATFRQITLESLAHPEGERHERLVEAVEMMSTTQDCVTYQAVVPIKDKDEVQGVGEGTNLRTCISEARKMAGRKGPIHVFITGKGGIYIAVATEDLPDYRCVEQVIRDPADDSLRVVWSEKDRGNPALVVQQ